MIYKVCFEDILLVEVLKDCYCMVIIVEDIFLVRSLFKEIVVKLLMQDFLQVYCFVIVWALVIECIESSGVWLVVGNKIVIIGKIYCEKLLNNFNLLQCEIDLLVVYQFEYFVNVGFFEWLVCQF